MRIAINARSLVNIKAGAGYYSFHLIQQLLKDHPQHEFYFFSDRPINLEFNSNTTVKIIGKSADSFLSVKRWLNKNLKKELQHLNADVLISLDGFGSLNTDTPQILGFTDLKFLNEGSFLDKYFKKAYFKKSTAKAKDVITVSDVVKKQLLAHFPNDDRKIFIVPKSPVDIFQPITWEHSEAIKKEYANGKEYFLFVGGFDPTKNLLTVLKAFSEFKKWQQSEWKLVVVGNISTANDGINEKLQSFKFRDDVVLVGDVEQELFAKLMASSYAMLYTSSTENYGMPILEALRSGVPVITSSTCAVTSMIDADTTLIADVSKPKDIASQMIKLYQDEDLRNRMIEKGITESQKINWKSSAELLWQLIEKAAHQK